MVYKEMSVKHLLNGIAGKVKVKGKVHPTTGHEGPEGKKKYKSTLSLTSALDWGGWSTPSPGRFSSGKEIVYPLYRSLGWPRGWSGWVRKFLPHRDSIPGLSGLLHELAWDWTVISAVLSQTREPWHSREVISTSEFLTDSVNTSPRKLTIALRLVRKLISMSARYSFSAQYSYIFPLYLEEGFKFLRIYAYYTNVYTFSRI
jgi:hypothetical protein